MALLIRASIGDVVMSLEVFDLEMNRRRRFGSWCGVACLNTSPNRPWILRESYVGSDESLFDFPMVVKSWSTGFSIKMPRKIPSSRQFINYNPYGPCS